MADSISYLIANHRIRIVGDDVAPMLRGMYGFPVFEVEDGEPEWQITFGCQVAKPDHWTELYHFVFDIESVSCSFAKTDDAYYFTMVPHDPSITPMLMCYRGGNEVQANVGINPVMLRFALWMAVSMLSCSSKMVLIHSSVIVHQNRAVLFLGESGTGKSTHTRLWLKHIPDAHLLNDDSPILAVENGEAVVYGSPWSGKTHCYNQLRFPLAGAVRLSQAPYNKIHRLSTIGALSAIHPSCPPALAQDDAYQDMIVDMLSDVLDTVPVFHLECLPDEAAAWTSHDAIFNNH